MNHKCPNCGLICKKMMLFNSQIVYTLVSGKGEGRSGPKDDYSYMDDGEDFIDSVIGTIGVDIGATGSQKYLTPSEAKYGLLLCWQYVMILIVFITSAYLGIT
jgi:hypothetical protein